MRVEKDVRKCMRCRLLFNPHRSKFHPRAERAINRHLYNMRMTLLLVSCVCMIIIFSAMIFVMFHF